MQKKRNDLNSDVGSNVGAKTRAVERKIVEKTFEISGSVFEMGEIQTYSSGFRRREMVLLTEDYHPQAINLMFKSKDVDLLNGIGRGERVVVTFRLEGWSHEGRYFTCLRAFDLLQASQMVVEAPVDPSMRPDADEMGLANDAVTL